MYGKGRGEEELAYCILTLGSNMSHRVTELYSIMPIANVPSVLCHGILSHARAVRMPHADVSMPEVQARRSQVQVPMGMPLHQYANLYFCARNPMLFKLKERCQGLCVLCVSLAVLDITGAVVSDMNASSSYARFYPPAEGMRRLDFNGIVADDWTDPVPAAAFRKKSLKCAEALVPSTVPAAFLTAACVAAEAAGDALKKAGFPLSIRLMPAMFFL